MSRAESLTEARPNGDRDGPPPREPLGTDAAAAGAGEQTLDDLPVGLFRLVGRPDGPPGLQANRALLEMLGYESTEQMLEGNLAGIFVNAAEGRHFLAGLACGAGSSEAELLLRRRDGTSFWAHVTTCADGSGPGRRVVRGVVQDITRRRQLETQLAQSQKLEAMGQLAAGIAHEINTPIQYVGDNTRFLGEGVETLLGLLETWRQIVRRADGEGGDLAGRLEQAAEQADLAYLVEELPSAVEQALEGVGRVAEMVRAMKEFAHPDGEEKTPTDLNHLVESTVTLARNEWKYVAEMQLELDPDLPEVPLLAGDIKQVVLNLLVNAAHAIGRVIDGASSGGKGLIRVSTRRDGPWAELRIADTGCGIPPEAREKVFELFYTTKPLGQGTGQGLAISRAIVVEKHAGAITFESTPGEGTTFIVRLPLAPPPERKAPST